MVRINWTKIVTVELKSIFGFIFRDSQPYAQIHVKRLKTRVVILKANPCAGRMASEIGDARYRELIEKNYRIIHTFF